MKRILFSLGFLLTLVLFAITATVWQRPRQQCIVDGTDIIPITRVEISEQDGTKNLFCSVCCARVWLDRNPEVARALDAGQAGLTVVDEVSGLPVDGSLAYWIRSDQFSRRENKCQLHVFKEKQDAARHLRNFAGQEMTGYLAGLGKKLPWASDFTAPDQEGAQHQFHEYRGQVVFLRFWSSVNPFARTDLANLQQAYDRFKERGFTVVAVNVEQDPATVRNFVKELDITFPVLLDPSGKIADQYSVTGYPTGFLLDRAGIVQSSSVGEVSAELMEPLLYPLW